MASSFWVSATDDREKEAENKATNVIILTPFLKATR